MAEICPQARISQATYFNSKRPAVVIDGGGIAQRDVSEVAATPPPIWVEFLGGTRVSIEANAPSALVLAVLRSLR